MQALFEAWKVVRSKNTAGGIDGVTLVDFEKNIEERLSEILKDLQTGKWIPEPYLYVEIPKNETEKRKLGLLSVKDKIVQVAIKTLVEPIFEKMFVENSYGYRPEKGHTKAIRRAFHECRQKKNNWALRLDVDNYFDTIDHQLLSSRLHAVVQDEEIVRLMMLSMQMGNVNKHLKWRDCKDGIPQGAILSPLLSNFFLHEFDKYVQSFNCSYIRYADDFVVMCGTQDEAHSMYTKMTLFLKERLNLTLNTPQIVDLTLGFEFLGITISKSGLGISSEKEDSIKQRINSFVLTSEGLVSKSNKEWDGIRRYYGLLLPQEILQRLDGYLYDRLKECIVGQSSLIPNKSKLQLWLGKVDFLSAENQLHKRRVVNELIAAYNRQRGVEKEQITKKQNKRIIDKKKIEYQKRESENCELLVNSYGCYLGITEKGISIKKQGKQVAVKPVTSLTHITICTKGVSLSSNLIEYCMNHKIAIDFFTSGGVHTASILSGRFLQCTYWSKQAQCTLERRNRLAAMIITAKIKNQYNLVKYFHKYHKRNCETLVAYYEDLSLFNEKYRTFIKAVEMYDGDFLTLLLGFESQAAVKYWAYIRELLKDDGVEFEKRERKGAKDLVNSMLNYGYALLYNRAWKALLGARLNPYDSVIHVRQNGKPTFVYDFVEMFRSQVVDRVVMSLVQKGSSLAMEGDLLNANTKSLLAKMILERLNRYEKYRGEELTLQQIIQRQAIEIAAWYDIEQRYKPYIAKW